MDRSQALAQALDMINRSGQQAPSPAGTAMNLGADALTQFANVRNQRAMQQGAQAPQGLSLSMGVDPSQSMAMPQGVNPMAGYQHQPSGMHMMGGQQGGLIGLAQRMGLFGGG